MERIDDLTRGRNAGLDDPLGGVALIFLWEKLAKEHTQHPSGEHQCEGDQSAAPSDEPEDIYGRVASMVSFDRTIVKRPVMTYFYGSDPGGFTKKNGRWERSQTTWS